MSKLNGSWKITVHTYMGDMRSTGYFTVILAFEYRA